MVGNQYMSIANHAQVEKALDRLRAMGLKVTIYPEDDNTAFIFITLNSILKLIEKQIKFPNKQIYYENPYVVIKVWRNA